MLLELLNSLSHVFYMALHVVNAGSFPRPLTADKEPRISGGLSEGRR